MSAPGHEDVGRLDVAVNDSPGVGGFERIGEFDAKFKDVCRGQRTAGEELMQRSPLQELHGIGGCLHREVAWSLYSVTRPVSSASVRPWSVPTASNRWRAGPDHATSLYWWLMTAGPADLDELDGAYRRLRPEHRHAVRSNLTLLSLIEARTGMPDPRLRRVLADASVACLVLTPFEEIA
jgi:hypothetical protein